MFQKYWIPKTTLYYILKEERQGQIPWFEQWMMRFNDKILSSYEKNFISSMLNPPNFPMTLNKLNLALNNEFGERNRSKAI